MALHHRVTGTAIGAAGVAALVEGEKRGARTIQACGHLHLAIAHGKVHQGATWEGEQRLGSLTGGPSTSTPWRNRSRVPT